ncbi:InlB B-repeat-containing protein [uncultured Dubosiella sp.]|nr:InlB B-repeat-containing protein [uncultured Dubosiella sp.]
MVNAVDPKKDYKEKLPVLDKVLCTAGDEVQFNGAMIASYYPYTGISIINDPEIIIRLPEKISIEDLELYQQTGSTAEYLLLENSAIENGDIKRGQPYIKDVDYTITEKSNSESSQSSDSDSLKFKEYIISFKKPVNVGWFTNTDLTQYQLGISFKMKIAKDADAMTLDMRNCVLARSKTKTVLYDSQSPNNSSHNSVIKIGDTYYGTFNNNTTSGTKLSIVAARQGLTFDFGARLCKEKSDCDAERLEKHEDSGYVNFGNTGEKVYLKDDTDGIDLRFTMRNNTGRAFNKEDAEKFYYYIPVPKKGDNWDTHIQDKPFEFDMEMTGPAVIAEDAHKGVRVQYSTTVKNGNYNNVDQYVDASKITNWSQVKMIRISADPEYLDKLTTPEDIANAIPVDTYVKIYIHYAQKDPEKLVGKTINFGPCGYSPYTVGEAENGGHLPLPHIQAEYQTGIIAGKVFVDENRNGEMDGDEKLYDRQLTIKAPHQGQIANDDHESHEVTVKNGEFKFESRRADTYFLEIINPGSPNANDQDPWRFSTTGTRFTIGDDQKSAKATVVVNSDNSKDNQELLIGLQRPYTIQFKADNASLKPETVKVWKDETLGKDNIPVVAADSGWKYTGNWIDSDDRSITTDNLASTPIQSDKIYKAEIKKLYRLTYDGNGNKEGDVPQTTYHIEGENVKPNYTDTDKLKKDEKTIFAGWSTERITDILDEDASNDQIGKIITTDTHTMPARDVTLYAVYAYDNNGNGNPDYNDHSVHVRYHGNNNKKDNRENGDVICPHHHVVGEVAKLSESGTVYGYRLDHNADASTASNNVESHTFAYDSNIFIGWSTTVMPNVIETEEQYNNLKNSIVTEVTMLDKKPTETTGSDDTQYADNNGNTNVYAVWAADRNKNKIADYLEERTLTYEGNAQNKGTVDNLPSVVTKLDNQESLLSGDNVTLENTTKPKHSDVGEKKVVFIGWTLKQTAAIFSREDAVPETINQVTIGDSDAIVYAAWGYDEDGDNIADVLETYTLSYDLNGGNGKTPSKAEGLKKGESITISNQTGFTRKEKELFMGWSMKQHENAFTADQGNLINEILITGNEIRMGTKDITLYAVWARDSNDNQVADYLELIKVLYNGNALEGGTVTDVPLGSAHIPGSTASLNTSTKPSHTPVNGNRVVFIGWSTTQNKNIYGRDDKTPETITEIEIEAEATQDKTVYAVWGYDSDTDSNHPGYGIADVLERYSLSYDLNGGKETAPKKEEGLKKGEPIKISENKAFTRNEKEIFVGWSTTPHKDTVTEEPDDLLAPGDSISIRNNTILYAVWAKNVNGNGTPDYEEDTYQVTYHSNTDPDSSKQCAHGHVAGEKCTLLDKKEVNDSLHFKKEGAVWIGWSQTKSDENITSAAEENAAGIINELEISDKAEANTVYAVWAEDKNRNGTPDYKETGYSVLYHSNNVKKSMVIRCGHHHVAGETTELLPHDQLVGSEENVPASAPHTFTRDKAVLIGWSETEYKDIVTTAQNSPQLIKSVTFEKNDEGVSADQHVYAVWAEDKNSNGKPDYEEQSFTLSYNLNGGAGEGFTPSSYLPGETVTLPSDQPTHGDQDGVKVLFAGWSTTQQSVLSAGDSAPSMIRAPYTMPETDTTLYAVWAKDVNGNGIADYLEKTFVLTYDLNGGSAAGLPLSSANHVAGEEVVLNKAPVPTHKQENGTLVVFLGWTEEKPDKIYSATDVMPALLSSVRFGSKDITVYAAWGYDTDGEGADILRKYSVTYDANDYDAKGYKGTVPTEVAHKAGETFPIRHSDISKDDAIFAGWSTAKIEKVLDAYASDDDIRKIISSDDYTMPAANVTFYAVWAKDANGNGKPDYADSSVQIVYHANNGSDNIESCKHHHVAGEQVDLSKTTSFAKEKAVFVGWSLKPLDEIKTMSQYKAIESELVTSVEMKKSGNDVYAVWATASDGNADYLKEYLVSYSGNGNTSITVPDSHNYHEGELVKIAYPSNLPKEGVIFAGWSTTKIDQVLDAKADPELIKQIITSNDYTMPAHPVTFNAVWAVDSDGNGKPDFAEDTVHVQYHDGKDVVTCAHNHMVGTKAELVASASHMYGRLNDEKDNKNHSFKKEKAVFVGWSLKPLDEIKTMSQYKAIESELVASITMKAEGNDVYAVWAEDQNENGVADYTEHVTVIYDGNAQSGDTVLDIPSDSGIHLPGDSVSLSGKPEYKAKDEKTVVFLGWTKEKHAILTRTDKMPSCITKLTLKDTNETVYALWGYDEDKQNGADVLETYTLSYDLNGCTGKAPATLKDIAKSSNVTVASEKDFTRNAKEVFAGWSRKQYTSAVRSIDLNEIIVPGSIHVMPAENVTLYAVWAQDNNGNNVADYLEKALRVQYDGNAQQGGTVLEVPSASENHIIGQTVDLDLKSKPTHSKVSETPVVFIGWTKEKTDKIYSREDKMPSCITELALKDTDETVYAAWGYDSDQDGTADILETYKVQYDPNGGTGVELPSQSYRAGERYTILHPDKEKFKKDKLVFAGWSLEKIDTILTVDTDVEILKKIATAEDPVMPAHSVKYYAVWAQDSIGKGDPDYAQNAVHVQYHANNEDDPAKELVVMCPHHHIADICAELAASANALYGSTEKDASIKNHTFEKDGATFIGWSLNRHELVDSQDKYEKIKPELVEQVTPSNKTRTLTGNDVYAVWAVDENRNNIPDYEEWVHLSYEANGGKANTMPSDLNNYFAGTNAALVQHGNMSHEVADGKPVVFLGWTLQPADHIYKREETAPATVQSVTFGMKDMSVYAAWGYDEDNRNGADVLETYTISYDLNGGTGKEPATLKDIVKGSTIQLSAQQEFTKGDLVFVGWSRSQYSSAVKADISREQLDSIIRPGAPYDMPAENVTLYAVWAEDSNHNDVADYMEKAFTLRYEGNAQSRGTVSNCPSESRNHILSEKVTLNDQVPTHSDAAGIPVRFIGWTLERTDHIYEREETAPAIIPSVTFGSEDMTVYAAWGYDADRNGKADVLKDYTLTYDLNGGSGTVPAQDSYKAGARVHIVHPEDLAKGKAVFAGWSTEPIEQILKVDPDIAMLRKILATDEYTMPAANVTLYAVWAEDLDGNTLPDYAENAVHIQYHSNNEKDEQTVLCPHHHIIHTKAVLSSNAQYLYGRTAQDNEIKNHSFKKDKAVFVGWSKEKLDDIRTQTQYAQISGSLLGSEITLGENNDVYAVWAVDENENGVADYREGVQLSYDANAQSGTVSGMPKNVENGIPGDKITLTGSPEHDPVDGKAVLFLGWAEEPMPICRREDEDPTPELVSEVVLGTVDRKVYAVWGYDEDGKNGADVLETYTLSYDLNGGKGKAPSALTDIVKGTLVPVSKEHDFTRNDGEIFAGWSRTHQEEAFSVTDGNRYHALRLADETLKMPASDTTLYALWADDDNRNGIADFDEMVQLRYDSNVQENDRAHNMPARSIHLPGNTVTLSQNVPTYSAADGKSVLFLGWTDEPMPILAREDADPSVHLVKEVTLGTENRKVYAAWGYDEDGRNGADVLETYTLSYDLNGGKGKAPSALTDIAKGTLITILSDQSFTRGEDEVFAGWSLEKHEQAFTPEQNEALENACLKDPVEMGAKDLTLYAVWKKGNTMKEPEVSVTYDLNGGKWKDAGLPDTFTASKGTVHTVQAKPVRAGFEFTGWKDSQGHLYDPGDTLRLEDSVTLTAQWQAVSQRSASSRTPRSDRSSRTARSARTAQATHQAFWLSLATGSLAAAEVLRKKRKKK